MKEDFIVEESRADSFSTLDEEKRTAMRKFVKGMTLLCSIYDMNFKTSAAEYKLASKTI